MDKINCDSIDLLPTMKEQGNDTELYDADPTCDHVLDPNCWSGIRCLKCGGWFCY
jgi:hypothetical protein